MTAPDGGFVPNEVAALAVQSAYNGYVTGRISYAQFVWRLVRIEIANRPYWEQQRRR